MNSLVWFRNNLRVSDNISLCKACKAQKTIGIYFFDPRQFDKDKFGFIKTNRYRARFLIESVKNLRHNLKKLNIPLYVFYGKPEDIINQITHKHHIDQIHLQIEWTRDENEVLNKVKKVIPSEIRLIESCDQFLFEPEEIPYNDFKQIPNVFSHFRKRCEKQASIRQELGIPAKKQTANFFDTNTEIPLLQVLGLEEFEMDKRSAFPFKGGENEALARLEHYFWDTKKLAEYKKTRNGLIGIDYSSKFSAWLANGSISPVTIYWSVKKFEKQVKKNQDTYWLVFELIWRDYFKYISLKYGSKIFKIGGILDEDYTWHIQRKALEQWTNGTTKEPFVNANMKELLHTGWMSNRGRQNVASFWAKELKQDWRIGAAYFESMLIDYDVHSNWGNWMYNSGVGNDPRDRKFNIQRQADIYDSQGEFQSLWLQEL